MSDSLRSRLEALARGDSVDNGATPDTGPHYDPKEMEKCLQALDALIRWSKAESDPEQRITPPSADLPLLP